MPLNTEDCYHKGLFLHSSNHLEKLAHELAKQLDLESGNPFQAQTVVVMGSALAQWLNQQFCIENGISCQIDLPLPGRWLWQLAQELSIPLPDIDPLSRERMQWMIYQKVPRFLDNKAFAPIKAYLDHDDLCIKQWQLAGKIARLFDRYFYYRHEQLTQCLNQNVDELDWQGQLWVSLNQSHPKNRHFVISEILERLNHAKQVKLPPRLDAFAVQGMAPIFLHLLKQISQHTSVHIWSLSPTADYWGDLVPEQQKHRKILQEPETADYWQTGNPLLTSWGKRLQIFHDQLINMDCIESQSFWFEPESDSVLQRLQGDIYKLEEPLDTETAIQISPDDSIQIHSAHSPHRECQILHDQLLNSLSSNPDLRPEDILILCPKIEDYAPYIEAVFQQSAVKLPWNLSDTHTASQNPDFEAFKTLLALPDSRFQRSEILQLLSVESIAKQFDLNASDVDEIAEKLPDFHVYWGINSKHKKQLNLPTTEENTWHQFFQRVFYGYALDESQLYQSKDGEKIISPIAPINREQINRYARIWSLIQTLDNIRTSLDQTLSLEAWQQHLMLLMNTCFGADHQENSALQQIRTLIQDLENYFDDDNKPVPLSVIQQWFAHQLSHQNQSARFYSGGITICGMQPLRGVPFKLIALLGMGHDHYPQVQKKDDMDWLQIKPKNGDPNQTDEDKGVFLEAVLACRQQLIMTYTGRDFHSNATLPASILIQEMLAYLNRRYTIAAYDSLDDALIRFHPLQAFSAENYNNQSGSFNAHWFPFTQMLNERSDIQAPQAHQSEWPNIGFHSESIESPLSISLSDLVYFYKNPTAYCLQKSLNLNFIQTSEMTDDEPFEVNALDAYKIRDYLLKNWPSSLDLPDQHEPFDQALAELRSRGQLLHGSPGELYLSQQFNLTTAQLSSFEPHVQLTSLNYDIETPKIELQGSLKFFETPEHWLELTASNIHGATLLEFWIKHLLINCWENKPSACLISNKPKSKDFYIFTDYSAQTCQKKLHTYIDLYLTGLTKPIPFFPKSAWEWLEKGKIKSWTGTSLNQHTHIPGESEHPALALYLRGIDYDPVQDKQFQALSKQVFQDILNHGEWR